MSEDDDAKQRLGQKAIEGAKREYNYYRNIQRIADALERIAAIYESVLGDRK
jgi:hypothetical protein